MNKNEFLQIILPTGEYYSKHITDGLISVYFDQVKDIDQQVFGALVKNHMADPQQGQFWPTFAHLMAQAGTESDAAIQAGLDFDKNSRIDGTPTFDIQQETKITTASRRKKYVESQKLEWKKLTPQEKFECSNLLPNLNETKRIES